eukprot:g3743.t1
MFLSVSTTTLLAAFTAMYAFADPVPNCTGGNLFPRIAYLGQGYDLVQGNPQPWLDSNNGQITGVDPGWKSYPVIRMDNYSQKKLYDNACLVPNDITVSPTGACTYESVFSEVCSAAAYQHSLDSSVGASTKFPLFGGDWEFSGSSDYKTVYDDSSSSHEVFFSSSSQCEFYTAKLPPPFIIPELDPTFIKAVDTLLDDGTNESLVEFVQTYGTHYTKQITMGAKATLLFSLEESAYAQFSSSGYDISAAMGVSFGKFGGFNGHTNVNENDESYQQFNSVQKKSIISCVGAQGACPLQSKDHTPNEWSAKAQAAPIPLNYELESIANVLTKDYFPSDANIDAKRNNFVTFIKESYCSMVAPKLGFECKPPPKNGYWSVKANVDTGTQNRNQGAGKGLPNGAGWGAGVAVLGDQVYVTGGNVDELTEGVESYDPQTNSWTVIPDMPEIRRNHVAAVLKGKLYVCGGWDGDNSVDTVFIYNPYTTSWSQGPEMPDTSSVAAGGVIDDKLYIAGGDDDGDGYLSSLYIFDPETEEWTSGKSMSFDRGGHGATVLNGKLYVFGGTYKQGPFSGEVYDPTTDSWTDIDLPAVDFDGRSTAAGTLNGKIYVLPSYNDDFDQQFVYVYDPSNGDWFKAPDLKIKRSWLWGTLPTVKDKLYVVGSFDNPASLATEAFWNVSDTSTLSSPQ